MRSIRRNTRPLAPPWRRPDGGHELRSIIREAGRPVLTTRRTTHNTLSRTSTSSARQGALAGSAGMSRSLQAFVLIHRIAAQRLGLSDHRPLPEPGQELPSRPLTSRGHHLFVAAQDESACGLPVPGGFGETRLEAYFERGTEPEARARAPTLTAPGERHARIERQQAAHRVEPVTHLGIEARVGVEATPRERALRPEALRPIPRSRAPRVVVALRKAPLRVNPDPGKDRMSPPRERIRATSRPRLETPPESDLTRILHVARTEAARRDFRPHREAAPAVGPAQSQQKPALWRFG